MLLDDNLEKLRGAAAAAADADVEAFANQVMAAVRTRRRTTSR